MDSASISLFIADKIALVLAGAGTFVLWLASRYLVNNLLARLVLKGQQVEYGTFKVNGERARFEPGDFGMFKSRLHFLEHDEKTAWMQNSLITKKDIRFPYSTSGGSNGKAAAKD